VKCEHAIWALPALRRRQWWSNCVSSVTHFSRV